MNTLKLFLVSLLLMISLNSCVNENNTNDIEGLWVSTEETSLLFQPWAEKVALFISRDSSNILTARGFFIMNNEFKAEWDYVDIKYDTLAQKISLLDEDSDTLVCILDAKREFLDGGVHSEDGTPKPLDFVRAGRNLETRLLHPRIPDENGETTYRYNKPAQIDDGLKTESVYNSVTDTSSFLNLMNEVIDLNFGRMKSLLIIKKDKLVVEEYFYGYNRNEPHQIRSCTKSVTSLLLGITLDRHKEINTDQPIFSFFPEYDSLNSKEKEKITLKNILTMTSGLEWDDYPSEMFKTDDCFRFILSRPMADKPGERFNYNSGGTVLLGGVIEFLEGKKALAFADEYLFKPLGINNYTWQSHNKDILRCGEGLSLRPRDMAIIGLLVLNDGKWRDKQIVSKAWVRESTKPHVKESDYFDYGYQWWHHSKNNLQWWKEPNAPSPDEHDMITALGYAGQYIMIIRDLDLVIVTTSSDFTNGAIARSKIPMAIEKIVPLFEK